MLYVKSCETTDKQPTNNDDQTNDATKRKKFCTRGLESMIEGQSSTTRKHDARQCVLTTQELQRHQGRSDAEGMALAYAVVAQESAGIARKRACNDAKAITAYVRR